MSSLCVEAKFSQSLNTGGNVVLKSTKSLVLNKKIADLSSNGNLFDTLGIWVQRSRQRKHLAQLDKHLLNDIGLTEAMVAKEIAKPFWK
jgi:uncharacterized protein YjiS (DUF1127 family)